MSDREASGVGDEGAVEAEQVEHTESDVDEWLKRAFQEMADAVAAGHYIQRDDTPEEIEERRLTVEAMMPLQWESMRRIGDDE